MDLTERTIDSREVFRGRIIRVRQDTVRLPNGKESSREVVEHPGGVGILAIDGEDRVVLVRQYRYAFERVLTEIPDLVVKEIKTQYSIRNLGTHSVVLDALAEDSRHKLYNLELQVADQDDHQKRVRYYQSNIDISYLDKGKNYEELPELYLIYMTKFDLFHLGQVKYTIYRGIAGTDVILDNGVHELYINAANHDGTVVAELMEFFTETGTRKQQFPELSGRIHYLKEEQEGVTRMCEAVRKYGDEREDRGRSEGMQQGMQKGMQQGMQKGMQKGMQQERVETIRNALKMNLPLETVAQLVRLPVEEVRKLIAELEQ